MEKGSLACSHCNYQPEMKAEGWRKCDKCGMLWCPNCSPDSERCANCVGGRLVVVS